MAEQQATGGDVIPMPSCMAHHAYDFELQHCDSIARAFMSLITMFPRLTQRGARELSLPKVALQARFASQSCREVFQFLNNVLQALHVRITSPAGLLNQTAVHGEQYCAGPANRHAEVQLRALRMGLHHALEMCRSLTTLVAEEAQKVPGEHRRLAEVLAANQLVLGQLTQVATAVNQRVQQLSQDQEHRHDGGFVQPER
jgi:hypothetical protein